MFKTLLIANRGEIACRVIRTAKQMGIRCIAVYSEVDKDSLHVKMADEAFYLGPAPSRESYLNQAKIIAIAKQAKSDAIHPGYGFLSENTAFAKLCEENNIVFVGPPVSALNAMASKSDAKSFLEKHKIPCITGYHGEEQSPHELLKISAQIGFPVLLKAAAGGGGKGMRVVSSDEEFLIAFQSVQREALAAFGDDHVLIEKYLENPRHIEIQLFRDKQGNTVHLFERECSLQRRHQKVLEETPAPGLNQKTRDKMAKSACQIADLINYEGAGTIEFLVDKHNDFYFMEMNTRLQVEHPITEKITGVDCVEWQLRIAAGEKCPLSQKQIRATGHSIEVRICAEDPGKQFLPSSGKLNYLYFPEQNNNFRVDTGFQTGDAITAYYDSLIAKLIVWGHTREEAIEVLQAKLAESIIHGLSSNLYFLENLITQPDFLAGQCHTRLIESHLESLLADKPISPYAVELVALFIVLKRQNQTAQDPWSSQSGWQMNLPESHSILLNHSDKTWDIRITKQPSSYLIEVPGESPLTCSVEHCEDDHLHAIIKNKSVKTIITHHGSFYNFKLNHEHTVFQLLASNPYQTNEEVSPSELTAPLSGTISAVLVDLNKTVKKGTGLLVVEAMKMEHTIIAPEDGKVTEFYHTVGQAINEGTHLMHFEIIQ